MEKNLIKYKQSVIHYYLFGSGTKWLFCFHGYGEEGNSFYILEDELENDYTIVAIDFPFHGATDWKEGLLFTTHDLLQIISLITQKDNEPISLLGYSMGGRIALHILETIPKYIDRVVLVAPDGLHENFWYWLSTQTKAGNKLFIFSMEHPKWLFSLMQISNRAGLLNNSLFKIAHYYLDDTASRLLLYERWTTMRKFKIDFHKLKDIIHAYNIHVRFLFGSYDRIVLSKRAKYFKEGIEEQVKVSVIEAGHQLLKEKYAAAIATLFYK